MSNATPNTLSERTLPPYIIQPLLTILEFPYGKRDEQAVEGCVEAMRAIRAELRRCEPGPAAEIAMVRLACLPDGPRPRPGLPPGPAAEVLLAVARGLDHCLPHNDDLPYCFAAFKDGMGFAFRLPDSAGGAMNLILGMRREIYGFLAIPEKLVRELTNSPASPSVEKVAGSFTYVEQMHVQHLAMTNNNLGVVNMKSHQTNKNAGDVNNAMSEEGNVIQTVGDQNKVQIEQPMGSFWIMLWKKLKQCWKWITG